MNRRDFINVTGLAASAMFLGGCVSSGIRRKSDMPNIVFILADDLGYGVGVQRILSDN